MHQPPAPIQVPALYLYPLNDSFIPKHIHLPPGQHIKIGRQTNAKTTPGERNGFFDSKVLSRQHAEVWEDGGKASRRLLIYIKDVKSSNGTFINSERLSSESQESEPFELKTDDIVEFGIDIVGEDNKTIVHHKVAARVVCVFTQEDAQAAARAEQHQNPLGTSPLGQPGSSSGNAGFPFSGSQVAPGARRPPMQQQGLAGIGGMGANMRQPGKSSLTFDHIINRLQGELQKSRETGAELHSLTGAMSDIHETLGGNLPQSLSSYHPQFIPPVMPPQAPAPVENNSAGPSAGALADLQAQLSATQRSLQEHVEKIHVLETALVNQDAIKQEVNSLREMFEIERRELELVRASRRHRSAEEEEHDFAHDDDDARSVATVTPHELESVEEEDEEQLAAEEEEERRNRRDELRPRTPEPTGMGMYDEDHHDDTSRSLSPSQDRPPSPSAASVTEERLNELTSRLESALELSRTLQVQHSSAQSTISMLEAKVTALESLVQATQTQVQTQVSETAVERASLSALVNEWKKSVEGQWSGVQEEWSQERVRLARAHEEWEARIRTSDESLKSTVAKIDAGLANIKQHQLNFNGNARTSGLVTPPSPRSLSSDSGNGLNKRTRRRRSTSRARPRSRSVGSVKDDDSSSEGASHMDDKASAASVATGGLPPHPSTRGRSWIADFVVDADASSGLRKGAPYPITPDPPVYAKHQLSEQVRQPIVDAIRMTHQATQRVPTNLQLSTAVGVLIVSVAAAAVLWRVRSD
ncbi:hypothetical protein K488DRAFT_51159 [Vararia minispora EC-137]|uniref:Uncharacterized protein n=1 Tax=Vararia minispora EC-137 TaxID=1314806 RepID=A0ACB8QKF5_9AGAM|nr:hypothetical protein K488DRAFT_51159 [Vararia minispora EC-137]